MPSNDYVVLDEVFGFSDMLKMFGDAIKFKNKLEKNKAKVKADRLTYSSSIARAARNLTLSFPTICSDAVSGNTAAIINKAIETKNVTMIQMVAAAAHFTGYNGIDVVSKIHSNLGVNYNVDDYIDTILAFGKTVFESGDYIPLSGMYRILAEQMKQEFLESCNHVYPESSFNETAISDYYVVDSYGSPRVMCEARNNYGYFLDRDSLDNAKFAHQRAQDMQKRQDEKAKEAQRRKERREDKAESREKEEYRRQMDKDKADMEARKYNDSRSDEAYRRARDAENDAYNRRRDAQRDINDRYIQKHNMITQNLSAADVKKANELIPTLIVLRYQVANPKDAPEDANLYISDEFVAGVKSRLVPVPSNDIIDRIVNFNKSNPNIKGLIKATSGETKFCKDFLLAIQDAKIQAKKDSKLSKTNWIWRSLQARSNRSKLNRLARMQNGAAAISTLVITQQEVDLVKDEYNIDMNNPSVCIDFMDAYNLMAVVIVDEQLEVAHFIYDGDAYFEDLSFSSLQRENDKSYKQVIDLLNKSR